jgi:hypothetical protein
VGMAVESAHPRDEAGGGLGSAGQLVRRHPANGGPLGGLA